MGSSQQAMACETWCRAGEGGGLVLKGDEWPGLRRPACPLSEGGVCSKGQHLRGSCQHALLLRGEASAACEQMPLVRPLPRRRPEWGSGGAGGGATTIAFMEMSCRGAEQHTLQVSARRQPRDRHLHPRQLPRQRLPFQGFPLSFCLLRPPPLWLRWLTGCACSIPPSSQEPRAAGSPCWSTMGSEVDSCDLPTL